MHRLLLAAFAVLVPASSLAQSPNAGGHEVVDMVKSLCSGTSKGFSYTVDGRAGLEASKILLNVVSGSVTGSVVMNKYEYDGILDMQKKPEEYVKCVSMSLPLFMENFKKSMIIDVYADSDTLIRSDFLSDDDMKNVGCNQARSRAMRDGCGIYKENTCVATSSGKISSFRASFKLSCGQ